MKNNDWDDLEIENVINLMQSGLETLQLMVKELGKSHKATRLMLHAFMTDEGVSYDRQRRLSEWAIHRVREDLDRESAAET